MEVVLFTGIVESKGVVESFDRRDRSARLSVRAGRFAGEIPEGGSLAVNGVCLTATKGGSGDDVFTADVIGETLVRSNLGELKPGEQVNLERCVPLVGRFDGHIVQGHVDGIGRIEDMTRHNDEWITIRVSFPENLAPQVAEKGSIAVDGVSLTVTNTSDPSVETHWFEVGAIPTTLAVTTLGDAQIGDSVNLETDPVAKYLARSREFGRIGHLSPQTVSANGDKVNDAAGQASELDSVEDAIQAIARGGLAVVVDDEDRENEGDLIGAAALATPETLGFMIRYSSGVVCAPMSAERADELGLPPMVEHNEDPKATAYTVTCDSAHGVTTGISGHDRAKTLNVLAVPSPEADSLTRPGHVLPLRAVAGGVRKRPGHTEAAVELSKWAGVEAVGYIAEVNHDDGTMMRFNALREFANRHSLPMISIDDLIQWVEAKEDKTELGSEGVRAR
ncbi:3,4-dihydroxy-2-butanone-4-phosphate synthase [Kocuria sp. TGY1127_2]|uniref:3,4-dihydroxy-2-butanone-4-phosphate synthase n=1 Tax=Kocuria sp. TGY1127_2 TaxID=2711328 RepID=UPI001FAC1B3B|nr:3,4-dihydroxy-2-butanone-4-phosphate synthase [Kocuria sp. TGY1127_2]